MLGPTIALVALAAAFAWSVLNRGGVYAADWSATLLGVGLVSFFYWQFTRRRDRAPALRPWLRIAIWALPAYIALQLAPLPLGLVQVLSPARAELTRSLTPVVQSSSFVPLSSNPPATILGLFTILGYIATFFLVREIAWRWNAHCWVPVLPLLAVSTLEAFLGSYQFFVANSSHAYGTFTNYDHFSGSLEMTFPLAVLLGAALVRRRRKNSEPNLGRTVAACMAWAVAGLLLLGIACSLSRAGFGISLCTLFMVAALSIGFHLSSRRSRLLGWLAAAAVVLLLVVALPSEQLIGRLTLTGPEGLADRISVETRVQLWRETLPLIARFPVFGCGLGAYESNFLQFQAVAYRYRIQFAHNDYLHYLAELGVVGFSIIMAIVFGIMSQVFKGMSRLVEEDRRLLVIACAGSLVAMLLHSMVDFNVHIPANAMTLAWIAGVGSINGLD